MNAKKNEYSALLWFQVENCRSYRDATELDFAATRVSIPQVVRSVSADSKGKQARFLPVAGVFGANASGKSALIHAISDMRLVILRSFRDATEGGGLRRLPFLLDTNSKNSDTSFSIELILDGIKCEYGLALNDSEITSEYFYYYPNGARALVFNRDGNKYNFGKKFELAKSTQELLRNNTALLSFAGATEWSLPSRLFKWFKDEIQVIDESTRRRALANTAKLAVTDRRQLVLDLLCAADLGITDIESEPPPKELRERVKKMLESIRADDDPQTEPEIQDFVFFTHCGETCSQLDTSLESIGTITWAGLIHPLLEALEQGSMLLVDELDTSLHPLLVHIVIEIFQNPELNPRHAQLIFNAHDLTIFSASDQMLLGRDQLWFAEKDSSGATTLTSLVEYKARKDDSIQPRYLGGRYGALPRIDRMRVRQAVKELYAQT